LDYEAACGLGEPELERRLYPGRPLPVSEMVEPSMLWIHEKLRKTGVTLELLHEIGQEVEVRLTAKTLEAYWKGSRVATHVRCDDDPFRPSTNPSHRPPKHRALFHEGRDHLMTWAHDMGPSATERMRRFLAPAHNFAGDARRRSGYGLRKLGESYEPERIEEACRRVLAFERVSYKSVERTLRLGLDLVPLPEEIRSDNAQRRTPDQPRRPPSLRFDHEPGDQPITKPEIERSHFVEYAHRLHKSSLRNGPPSPWRKPARA
jgi:hypothetical protein